jgi:energy-coupling factor transport system substrate-specific component
LVDHAIEGTMYHHERYDGKGYPQGLSGEEIPLYGRIIGIADAFDAMTANRVYRKQLDFDIVLNELLRCKGAQFDPDMTDILLKLIEEGSIDVDALYGKPVLKEALANFKKDSKEDEDR